MVPFRTADAINRAISANAAYAMFEKYAPRFLEKRMTLEEFTRKTGIIYLEEAVQKQIVGPLSRGMEGLKEGATRYAMNLAEDTQWIYRAGNAPRLFRNKLGRLCGQFGIWPTNYIRFFKRGLATGNAAATEQFVRRWATVNTGLYLTFNEMLGIDLRPWIFTGPFTYGGGPGAQWLVMAHDFQRGGYRRELAMRELGRAGFGMIPFSYAIRDFTRGMESEEDAWKRFIGFREYPPRRDNARAIVQVWGFVPDSALYTNKGGCYSAHQEAEQQEEPWVQQRRRKDAL